MTVSSDLGDVMASVPASDVHAAGRGSSESIIETSLAALRRHLDMDVAFVGRVEGGRRVFDFVDCDSPDCPVRPGLSDPIEDTYCGRVIAGTIPQLLNDAGAEPGVADLAVTRELPVGAHMSVPLLRSSGDVLGTLCCFSYQPDPSLRQRDLQLLAMFAEIVSTHLEALIDHNREYAAKHDRITGVIDSGGPTMAMQPIVNIEIGQVRGFEALARFPLESGWNPQQWFAEAERVGLGVDLEASAVAAGLAALPQLPAGSLMSVNVSADALRRGDVLEMLTGEHAGRLVVELTEHTRIDDYGPLANELSALRGAGARLAVDDAGSGWAGLEHILALQPEVLKLDRALVTDVGRHPGRQAMVEAMLGFADRMGATLVAEGVETEGELHSLASLGVVYAQGYLLGRPTLDYSAL